MGVTRDKPKAPPDGTAPTTFADAGHRPGGFPPPPAEVEVAPVAEAEAMEDDGA